MSDEAVKLLVQGAVAIALIIAAVHTGDMNWLWGILLLLLL